MRWGYQWNTTGLTPPPPIYALTVSGVCEIVVMVSAKCLRDFLTVCENYVSFVDEMNDPPQMEILNILKPRSDDFRREMARRRRKILAFEIPK